MRVLGMISGTSHDGIDVAVVDFAMVGGTLAGRIEYSDSVPYDPRLRGAIIAALPPRCLASRSPASWTPASARPSPPSPRMRSPRRARRARPDLLHGQTVFHWVTNGHAHGTLQLGQPGLDRRGDRAPVISDVRAADLAAGGEGAPLVPVLDRMLLEAPTARPASAPGR